MTKVTVVNLPDMGAQEVYHPCDNEEKGGKIAFNSPPSLDDIDNSDVFNPPACVDVHDKSHYVLVLKDGMLTLVSVQFFIKRTRFLTAILWKFLQLFIISCVDNYICIQMLSFDLQLWLLTFRIIDFNAQVLKCFRDVD